MKNYKNTLTKLYFILIIILIAGFIHTQDRLSNVNLSQSSMDSLIQLESVYPSIKMQIQAKLKQSEISFDYNKAIRNLKTYLNSTNSHLKKGMEWILQRDFFDIQNNSRNLNITIDGNPQDWHNNASRIIDPEGDARDNIRDMDITEFNVRLDGSSIIFMIKSPVPINKDCFYSFLVECTGDNEYDFEVFFFVSNGHKYCVMNDFANRRNGISITEFEFETGDAFEGRVSLKKLGLNPDKLADRFSVIARLVDKTNKLVDDAAAVPVFYRLNNYALYLLLAMLSNNVMIKDDPIILAIALANNMIFSISNNQVKKVILEDCIKHFRLYEDLIKWQKLKGLSFSLSNVSLLAKLFWADRSRLNHNYLIEQLSIIKSNKINLKTYREFVDNVENFKVIRKIIEEKGLYHRSIKRTSALLENFVSSIQKYRSSMENLVDFNRRGAFSNEELQICRAEYSREYNREYMGKVRRWDGFGWLNYQLKLYRQTGFTKGDCGTHTNTSLGFYKAAGIAPVSFQYISPEGIAAYTHNFPGFYHPVFKRWITIQKPSFFMSTSRQQITNIPLFFHYSKPYYHHWLYNNNQRTERNGNRSTFYYSYYPGEEITSAKLVNFLTYGVTDSLFEKILLSDKTHTPGLFFNNENAPEIITDSDNDGIPDMLETDFGTNPQNPDSDNDGYSDSWEIENGFNPNDNASPGNGYGIAIDGITNPVTEGRGLFVTMDPAGDNVAKKEIFDVKSLSAKIVKENLYINISYHNNVSVNKLRVFSFIITVRGSEITKYWVQFVGDTHVNFFKMAGDNHSQWIKIKPERFEYALLKDAEFLIPLKYFRNAKVLTILHIANGYDKNNNIINGDITDTVRVPLTREDLYYRMKDIISSAQTINDPSGDYKSVKNFYDIKSVRFSGINGKLILFADYHNETQTTPFGWHTIHIRDIASKRNWWIQTGVPGYYNVYVWKEGEQLKKIIINDLDYDGFRYKKGYVFVIPLSLFGNLRQTDVQYITSGIKSNGDTEMRADETAWAKVHFRN